MIEDSIIVGVNAKELMLLAERILLETKERPVIVSKLDTLHCLIEVKYSYIDIPKKLGQFYGYEVVAIPDDDNILESNQIYVWNKHKVKQFILHYLKNKYNLILKELEKW